MRLGAVIGEGAAISQVYRHHDEKLKAGVESHQQLLSEVALSKGEKRSLQRAIQTFNEKVGLG